MASVFLDNDLCAAANRAVRSLPPIAITDTDISFFRSALGKLSGEPREALERVGKICRSLLRQNGYVHLRGLELLPDVRGVLALGERLGEVFADLEQQATIVVEASPTIGSGLQGNQTETLFLHTDFAMLEHPPTVSIIHCRQPDPMGCEFGRSGISVAQHIVSRLFGSEVLESFFKVPLPFGGRTRSGKELILHCPVLMRSEAGVLTGVRFHPSRIHHGFRLLGREASREETEVLRLFLEAASRVRTDLVLEPGDFLLVNNRVALHDRTRCSLELGQHHIKARVTHILFVQELAPV
jgi:hypothetical protein